MVAQVPNQPKALEQTIHEPASDTVNGTDKTTRPDYGFPRCVRLLKGSDFQSVFKGTECRSSDQVLTLLARHNGLGHARLGLAISKRFIKTAVGRNRVKRVIRDSFRRHQSLLVGLDIVVMSREGALKASNPELRKSLEAHWRRVAKRCETS